MAVYQRTFRPYEGEVTAPRRRFLVLARYALGDLLRSKLFLVFLTLCFVMPLFCLLAIYIRHNADLLAKLASMGADVEEWVPIDERFFGVFLRVQGMLSFFVVLFAGPRLVARDLANNGLALYLCRPFSKRQYVAGKLTVLAALVSLVTWVPGLLLWLLQAGLQGGGWATLHWRSAWAIFAGAWVWIVVIGFLALAVSAWVKWRPVAGFALLLIYVGGGFFGKVIEELFDTDWGYLVDVHFNIRHVWSQLFATTTPFFFGIPDLPAWSVWVALAALTALSLLLLSRRIRAYEVIS